MSNEMITRRGIMSAAGLLLGGCITHGRPTTLQVDGPVLRRGDRIVQLRGVAVGDPLLVRALRPVSDYDRLAGEWGVNVVRLSVHPGVWRAERDRMMALLDRDVRAATNRGLTVIIDWHSIGWPGGNFEKPQPSWGLPPDAFDADIDLAVVF